MLHGFAARGFANSHLFIDFNSIETSDDTKGQTGTYTGKKIKNPLMLFRKNHGVNYLIYIFTDFQLMRFS